MKKILLPLFLTIFLLIPTTYASTSKSFSICDKVITISGICHDFSDGSGCQVISHSDPAPNCFEITWDDCPSDCDRDMDIRAKVCYTISGCSVTVETWRTGYDAGHNVGAGYSITDYGDYYTVDKYTSYNSRSFSYCKSNGQPCTSDSCCSSGICNVRCCRSSCQSDGWYDTSDWYCSDGCKRCKNQEYRDYYCDSNGNCVYSSTATRQYCENCPSGTACSGGSCSSGYYCVQNVCDGIKLCNKQCDGSGNCNQLVNCRVVAGQCGAACVPGTCDYVNRQYCLASGQWSTVESTEYCSNCNHCGDNVCNCGETMASCSDDCMTGTNQFTFYRGWNLISIPFKTITAVQDPCNIFSKSFYYLNMQTKKWEITTGKQIEGGKGYWVYCEAEECVAQVSGSGAVKASDIPPLIKGYNLVGTTSSAPYDIQQIKGTCSISIGPLYWNAVTQRWVTVNTMEPGKGYWVYVNSDCQFQ